MAWPSSLQPRPANEQARHSLLSADARLRGRGRLATAGLRGFLSGGGLVEHAHDVALLHDQELDAVELDLGARPLAEQHAVADLEVDRDQFAGFVAATRADRGDLTLRGLFLGGVRNDNAALGLLFG